MAKQRQEPQLKLTSEQLQNCVFHGDPMAGYGSGTELQQARVKLLLAADGVELLETYRYGSDIRLILSDNLKNPVRYTIAPSGTYSQTQIPRL